MTLGGHLSLDDLRAVVFDDRSLTSDFARASSHLEQCSLCRAVVDDERRENPLLQADDCDLPVAADQ